MIARVRREEGKETGNDTAIAFMSTYYGIDVGRMIGNFARVPEVFREETMRYMFERVVDDGWAGSLRSVDLIEKQTGFFVTKFIDALADLDDVAPVFGVQDLLDPAALPEKAFSVIDPANFRNETPRVRFPLPSIEQGSFLVYHCLDGFAERLTPEVVRKQGEPLLRVWNYQIDLKSLRLELEERERQIELADKTATLEARATKARENWLATERRLTDQLRLASGALESVASQNGPLVSLAKLISADNPDVEAMRTAVLELAMNLTNGLSILTGQPMRPLRRDLFSAMGDGIITSAWLSFVSGDAFRAILKRCAAQSKEQMRDDLLLLAEEIVQNFLDAIRTDQVLGTKYHRGRALDLVIERVYADFAKRVLPEYDSKSIGSDFAKEFKA